MLKRRPLDAWRALRSLMRDPQDTAQVFTIMRALTGDAIAKGSARFSGTSTGQALLIQPRDIVRLLSDRQWLGSLTDDSVGSAYLALVQRAGISPDELISASEEVAQERHLLSDTEVVYAQRLRDTHDLWHVVTGYGTDTLGEVCVVAFSYAQTKNLGFAAIALIGALKIARESGAGTAVMRAVWQAYRAGRRAAWLPAAAWEDLLLQPLARTRQQLRIGAPDGYRAVLTARGGALAQAA